MNMDELVGVPLRYCADCSETREAIVRGEISAPPHDWPCDNDIEAACEIRYPGPRDKDLREATVSMMKDLRPLSRLIAAQWVEDRKRLRVEHDSSLAEPNS